MAALVQLEPGVTFARDFLVERPLAEGGMGAVYVVEQRSTGKQRALKIMHPQLVKDPRHRERFAQEARAGAKIDSDHVVEVVAAGVDEDTGTPWLAMELLRGQPLTALVERRGGLPAGEAREVFRQLCHALSAAHRAGMIHRDLKPDNLFMAAARRSDVPFTLKVLDFGIAKLVQENQSSATATGAMGTPLWMAPEQADARGQIGPTTDVWALGLIGFYVLTARSYWRAANLSPITLHALLAELLFAPLDPASMRAAELDAPGALPPGFDAWFARCVAREPARRFASADEALASLLPVLDGVSGESVPRPLPPVPEELTALAEPGEPPSSRLAEVLGATAPAEAPPSNPPRSLAPRRGDTAPLDPAVTPPTLDPAVTPPTLTSVPLSEPPPERIPERPLEAPPGPLSEAPPARSEPRRRQLWWSLAGLGALALVGVLGFALRAPSPARPRSPGLSGAPRPTPEDASLAAVPDVMVPVPPAPPPRALQGEVGEPLAPRLLLGVGPITSRVEGAGDAALAAAREGVLAAFQSRREVLAHLGDGASGARAAAEWRLPGHFIGVRLDAITPTEQGVEVEASAQVLTLPALTMEFEYRNTVAVRGDPDAGELVALAVRRSTERAVSRTINQLLRNVR